MYKDALALLAACIGWLFSILVKALIKPCGFRVSSTELASARYSRFLDRAIWARLAARGPRIRTKITPITPMIIPIVPPSRSSSSSRSMPKPNQTQFWAKSAIKLMALTKTRATMDRRMS